MLRELIGIAITSLLFLILLATGEVLRSRVRAQGEFTRKFVHFGGCAIAMLFPLLLKSHWSVLFLGIAFGCMMGASKKWGYLRSIHDVKRETHGGIYHPAAIYLSFLISSLLGHMVFYPIALMVLALSDSMAAIVGKIYGIVTYRLDDQNRKSLEGSAAFFVLTFLIVHLSLLLATDLGRVECVLTGLLTAIVITAFEAISLGGADNLFIPLGTIFILAKNVSPQRPVLVFQFAAIFGAALLLWLVMRPFRKFGFSGYIVSTLALYTAWGLVNFYWMLPLLYALLLTCRSNIIMTEPQTTDEVIQVRPAFYLLLIPVFWMLAANLYGKVYHEAIYPFFFAPYLAAITTQLTLFRLQAHGGNVRQPEREALIIGLVPVLLCPIAFGEFSWRVGCIMLLALLTPLLPVAVYRLLVPGECKFSSVSALRWGTTLTLIASLMLCLITFLCFFSKGWLPNVD